MKILVTSINFSPDHSGTAIYATDLPVYFAERGHDVTMVTGFPYYPFWRKPSENRRQPFAEDEYRKVRVLRGYLYVPRNPTVFRRVLHEASFTLFAFLNFLKAGRHDCIVVISPPLLLGLVGIIFKLLWRAQLVVHIQDLQPDAALSLGMVKSNLLIRLLTMLEAFVYRHASWIATITVRMKENLRRKGIPEEKLAVHYNWINVDDVERFRLASSPGNFLAKHPIAQGKFTVAYAGNIGVKQGVETLIELAAVSQTYEDIHYFVIGEGSRRPQLEELVKDKVLTNITFLPFLPQKQYFEMLQDIHVSFISQKPGTGDVFFPSKLLGIMAMGKPLLVSADPDSELATTVSQAECGLVSAPNDFDSLLRNVVSVYMNPGLRQTLGQNGSQHVKFYDRKEVLSRFLAQITKYSTDTQ